MTTDLTSRITTLVAAIEAQLTADEEGANAAGGCRWIGSDNGYADGGEVTDEHGERVVYDEGAPNTAQAMHIARHDPARVLRDVAATRALVAAILELPHVLDEREWYGCQAIDEDGNRIPGRDCTCGRDEDVARLLSIIASEDDDEPEDSCE